ncbi:IclR family transcriptional regulator [Actinomycetospora soli]|uniref:IclR family transcriptional regulator n=1 Tax=Actinomycetospora soli TaxID=2893887 RepID=UPI001E3FD1AA|nr:IclR family transcriptional regulator [Actinomycetospora soli]MCD2189603.1 IclR family transcriptional regulator [Actinomycetospora soli]
MNQQGETEDGSEGRIRGAETARRTLRLLEALAAHQPVGLDEVAALVGLNKSTAYRLLRVLQEEGYCERLPQGGYRLGGAVATLAARTAVPAATLEAMRPVLQELAESTAETVTVHRRAGDAVVLSVGVESEQHVLRQVVRVGETTPLTRGCAGLAILASLPASDRDEVLDHVGGSETRSALGGRVAEALADGYAVSRAANHPGVFGIAVAVPGGHGTGSELSLAVSGPESRWTRDRAVQHAEQLRECAARLAHLLGV